MQCIYDKYIECYSVIRVHKGTKGYTRVQSKGL